MAQVNPQDAALDPNIGLPDANYPLMTADQVEGLAERALIMSEGINGPNSFSTEAAAYGYIERQWRVVVPATLRNNIVLLTRDSYTDNPRPERFINPVQHLTILYWNFLRMTTAGVNNNQAFFTAAYRARLIFLGYLYPERNDRSVTIDEVDFWDRARDFHSHEARFPREARRAVGREGEPGYQAAVAADEGNAYGRAYLNAASDSERVRAYFEHGADNKFKRFISYALNEENLAVTKHLTFSAQQYAAMTYLVFRQHGHHYKTEFDNKYNVLWRATTIESSSRYPGNEIIHRNAIHSFGVKALHLKFFQNLRLGKLADTFVDRQDVAPAGTAVVATCNAAIDLMKALPVWNQMYSAYKVQIDELATQAKKLKNAERAIQYHKNARLFGVQRFQLDLEIAQSLAPIAKGFIESLGPDADLSRQKALDKRAQQNPLVTALVSSVINKVTRSIARSGDMSAFTRKETEEEKAAREERERLAKDRGIAEEEEEDEEEEEEE